MTVPKFSDRKFRANLIPDTDTDTDTKILNTETELRHGRIALVTCHLNPVVNEVPHALATVLF